MTVVEYGYLAKPHTVATFLETSWIRAINATQRRALKALRRNVEAKTKYYRVVPIAERASVC
eukprot:scaffold288315_cov39-Prasinocladus_malaysianus.AAC.1